MLNIKKIRLDNLHPTLNLFFFRTKTPDIEASDKKLSLNVPS